MPDIPNEKPVRGQPSRRGRGAAASAATALPAERLSSIRNQPLASTSATPSTTSVRRFTPKVPVRRNKKEPSALLADKKPEVKRESSTKFERGRGRGATRGGRGGQPELVQAIAGPFAQGPASLGGSATRRAMGSVFLGGGSGGGTGGGGSGGGSGGGGRMVKPGASLPGITGAGFVGGDGDKAGMEVDDDGMDGDNQPMVSVTDHNEALASDELAVQTEEMAIAAAESMSRLCLDTSMAELFTPTEDDDEERLVVFQLPILPDFELSEETAEMRRQRRVQAEANIMELDAAAELVAMAADVKPDLAALTIDEEVKKEEEEEDNEDALVEGRIGTLVVLKSGAVKIRMGDVLLDVSRGADCQFFRGLMALDGGEDSHAAFLLANVDAVAMCTPDLESIL
ncbi:hypothetical protein IWW39_002114 [Coemansia spiralis]|uniref:DNA-directed RNA polymerase III subunit RPC4 n=1 Tax=Coemansia spiralis TaxID=417178 RepID=A0A9W8GLU0_9FUNG|nr:hypothetical protein IWW39_002114 [Coemansia spiralis]